MSASPLLYEVDIGALELRLLAGLTEDLLGVHSGDDHHHPDLVLQRGIDARTPDDPCIGAYPLLNFLSYLLSIARWSCLDRRRR